MSTKTSGVRILLKHLKFLGSKKINLYTRAQLQRISMGFILNFRSRGKGLVKSRWLFIFLILLSACVKGQKQNQNQGESVQTQSAVSTFYHDRSVVGESKRGEMSAWDTPITKIFRFTVCFKDRSTKSALLNQPLIVSDEQGKQVSTPDSMTDNSGCLMWNDSIAYNYFADSKYVEIFRTVRGKGSIHRGEVRLKLCIDPWAEQDGIKDEVLDCGIVQPPTEYEVDRSHSPSAFAGMRNDQTMPKDIQLWLENPRLTLASTTISADRAKLHSILHFKPGFIKKLINGSRSNFIPLPRGRFQITPYLITKQTVEDQSQSSVTAASKPLMPKTFANSDFVESFDFIPPTLAQICEQQFALRVDPIGAPQGHLRSADFIFHMGDCSHWTFNDALLKLDDEVQQKLTDVFEDQSFRQTGVLPKSIYFLDQFQQALGDEKINKTDQSMNGQIPNRQFLFEPLFVRFDSISRGETATHRTLVFTASTCVHNAFNRQRLGNFHFDVYKILLDPAGNKIGEEKLNDRFNNGKPYSTDDINGCVTWKDSIDHEYYVREHYFQNVYELRHVGSDYSKSTTPEERRLTAVINPWDYGFTFGRDISYAGGKWAVEAQEKMVKDKPASRLVIYSFKYETIVFRYEIDKHMNLKVQKNVLLRIEPQVIRMHSIVSGRQQSHESLRNGYYLLKTALQKYYDDRGIVREYLDTFQKIVQVQGGVIVAPTKFSVSDLRLMRVRNNMLIELQPVDERALCDYSFRHDNPEKISWSEDRLRAESEMACSIVDLTKQLTMPPEDQLDQYILKAEQTGLEPRTFVGPVTPQSNSFSSNMWPTDSLDESDCTTETVCREIRHESEYWVKEHRKNANPENDPNHVLRQHVYGDFQKFFESSTMRPLKGTTVTSLVQDQKLRYNEISRVQRQLDASIFSVAQNLNLEYMQILHPETIDERLYHLPLSLINRALPTEDLFNNFLKSLNSQTISEGMLWGKKNIPPLDQTDFVEFFKIGQMSKSLSLRLCHYWFHEFLPLQLKMKPAEFYATSRDLDRIDRACKNNFDLGDVAYRNGIFAVDQRLKVDEVGDYGFEKGMSINISLNADKRRSMNQDFKRTTSLHLKLPTRLPVLPSLAPAAMAYNVIAEEINQFTNFLQGNIVSLTRGQSSSLAGGHSASVQTTLAVQIAKFNVTLNKYEACKTIGLRPEFIQETIQFFHTLSPKISDDLALDLATRGILLCTGEPITDRPKTLRENYYYVSQNFAEGDMMDVGNLKTHPWLLQIRGYQDFAKFMTLVVEKTDLLSTERIRMARQRIEEAEAVDYEPLGIKSGHHRSEPEGVVLQSTKGEDPLDMTVPVEARGVAQLEQKVRLGLDPLQLDLKQQTIQKNNQARTEYEKLYNEYKQNHMIQLDAAPDYVDRQNESVEDQRQRVRKMTKYSAKNAVQFWAGSKSEADRRWRLRDVRMLGVNPNIVGNLFNPISYEGFDKELKDYPLLKLGEIYSGTPPSSPGFITVTEDSIKID